MSGMLHDNGCEMANITHMQGTLIALPSSYQLNLKDTSTCCLLVSPNYCRLGELHLRSCVLDNIHIGIEYLRLPIRNLALSP